MLSIITNFGCDERCPYCIWNEHFLKNTFTSMETTDWERLITTINEHSPDRISISGGGDPLFELEKNIKWWQKLFYYLPYVLLDLHTAKIAPPNFARKFNKYVFHAKDLQDYYNRIDELTKLQIPKKRVVIVADRQYTEKDYLKAAQNAKDKGCSFSVRQLVENNKPVDIAVDFLKNNPDLFYIEQADYNLYFMPDNNVYAKFLEEDSHVKI